MTRRSRESGGSGIQTAAMMLPMLVLLLTLVGVARAATAQATVGAVAFDAARAASISRSPGQAQADADAAAAAGLSSRGLRCATRSTSVDISGFAAPPGTPATVTATVSCAVPLGDLAVLPGMPAATRTFTTTVTSPIDTYRERDLGFGIAEGSSGLNWRVG